MNSQHDELSRTKYCAILILGRKSHTKKELYDKLIKKGYSEECVEQTVLYAEENGYINDRDYAEKFLHDAVELKKHGISRVRMDLRRKGIADEIIEEVISECEYENSDTIEKILESRAKNYDLNDKKQRDRLIGYMLRRGFSFGEVYSALKQYMEDGEEYYD